MAEEEEGKNKLLFLVRHAQGHHNVGYAGAVFSMALQGLRVPDCLGLLEQLNSFELEDASLTARGWKQVGELRERCQALKVDLVVVSPMTRALQTAVGLFGGGEYKHGNEELPPLMIDGVGACPGPPVSSSGCPPFVALELCREHSSVYACDKRSSLTKFKERFPAVDFSENSEEDPLWNRACNESVAELDVRRRRLLCWLAARKEYKIVVVSHSGFLSRLVGKYEEPRPNIFTKKRSSFSNAELREVLLLT